MSDFNTEVVVIPEENIERLTKKVEQINKKAVKNGLVPMVLTIGEVIKTVQSAKNVMPDQPFTEYTTYSYPVSISGEYPAINGWKCIAKIDHRDGVNLIAIYDEMDVSKWRERKPTCDHCGHNKIKVQSFLIQNEESGEILQIGKSCIQDYIQGDPKYMLQMLTWVRSLGDILDEEYSMGGSGYQYFDVETVAKVSALSIRKNGFVPSSAYGDEYSSLPTVQDVNNYYFGTRDKEFSDYWAFEEVDEVNAKDMIEYFNAETGDNNFVITIKQLLELCDVRSKFFSYIAGAMSGYFKKLDRDIKDAHKKNRSNEYVGEIKKRQDFTVTLENITPTNSFYGVSYIHRFIDSTGNTIIWFAGGVSIERVGETFKIKATPKKHQKYGDTLQTVVTRCVVQ